MLFKKWTSSLKFNFIGLHRLLKKINNDRIKYAKEGYDISKFEQYRWKIIIYSIKSLLLWFVIFWITLSIGAVIGIIIAM